MATAGKLALLLKTRIPTVRLCLSYLLVAETKYLPAKVKGGKVYSTHSARKFHSVLPQLQGRSLVAEGGGGSSPPSLSCKPVDCATHTQGGTSLNSHSTPNPATLEIHTCEYMRLWGTSRHKPS